MIQAGEHLTVAMARVAVRKILDAVHGEETTEDYRAPVNILCIMDTGTGAAIVKRTRKRAQMTYLPILGHLLKKAWGWWYRITHSSWRRRIVPSH